MFKSAAAFFRAANGQRVTKRVTGVPTWEDWNDECATIKRQLIEQGCKPDDIIITDDKLSVSSTNQLLLRSKLRAVETGVLTVRSSDYHFLPDGAERPVYGDKKGAKVAPNGALVKEYANGMKVTFEL